MTRPIHPSRRPEAGLCDARGAVVVEMALVAPLLLSLLMGIVAYGDWFLTAHGVQQAANDAARAAIAGLTATERQRIAVEAARNGIRRGGALDPDRATYGVDDDGSTLVVRIRYDAAADPLLRLPLVPMPPTTIGRDAAVRLDSL